MIIKDLVLDLKSKISESKMNEENRDKISVVLFDNI